MKEEHRSKIKRDKEKADNNMVDLSSTISIIILNVNG